MVKTVSKDAIKLAFSGVGLEQVNASLLSKCSALANSLHLSPETMAEVWEAFSLNKNITHLTDHSWKSYRSELQKEADRNPNQQQHTPMDEADDDNDTHNIKQEGAVAVRRGMGKRQVGSPSTAGTALVTPPTKRMAKGAANNNNAGSAVDALATAKTAPTPSKVPSSSTAFSAAASTYTPPKYEERTGAGKVVLMLNPNDLQPTTTAASSSSPRCGIAYQHFDTNVQKPYRHLFTTMEDRAKALDRQLVHLEDILMEQYKMSVKKDSVYNAQTTTTTDKDGDTIMSEQSQKEGENENDVAPIEGVGVPRQEKICCIGRICNSAHEGRINLTSVVLEGSKHLGGARIELDLTHLQEDKSTSFSLFPGQIIAVEGMNSTGRRMTAHRICEGAAHGANKSTVKELMHYHHDDTFQNGAPLKIMSVAGPYTTSDNLNYDPLFDFMDVVLREKPDVVIMVGPFVDMRHKDIQSGEAALPVEDGAGLSVPFEAVFANKVAALLEDFFHQSEDIHTQFVLVPSLDDATAEWVYPQPPLQDRVFGKRGKVLKVAGGEDVEVGTLSLAPVEVGAPKSKDASAPYRRIHCVSNPCTLQVNELVIGVTGTDAVFHMSADECNGNLVPGSRLARISQHMLQQQTYYPLFPPALGTNLDLKHMKQWSMPCQPDLLIVPSKLTSFARPVLGDTVVVNPGQLTKNTTGGTYAIMDIHPKKRNDLENVGGDDVELEHNIADRIRLEIKKI